MGGGAEEREENKVHIQRHKKNAWGIEGWAKKIIKNETSMNENSSENPTVFSHSVLSLAVMPVLCLCLQSQQFLIVSAKVLCVIAFLQQPKQGVLMWCALMHPKF